MSALTWRDSAKLWLRRGVINILITTLLCSAMTLVFFLTQVVKIWIPESFFFIHWKRLYTLSRRERKGPPELRAFMGIAPYNQSLSYYLIVVRLLKCVFILPLYLSSFYHFRFPSICLGFKCCHRDTPAVRAPWRHCILQ